MTTGWQCPNCSRCYAPSVTQCPACDPSNRLTVTNQPFTWEEVSSPLRCRQCGKQSNLLVNGIGYCCQGRTA